MTVVENIRSFLETRNGEGLDLTGAYLTEANLSSAHLEGANLSGAHLEGANLSGANLFFTNLTNADLSGANLVNAKLVGANLKEANLVNANLKGTDLTGANVSGANFINAYGITGDTLRAYGVENLDIAKNVPEVLREPPSSDSLEGVPEGDARPLSSLSQEIQNISYFTLTNKLKSKKDKILININEEVVGQMMGEDLMLEENTVIIKEYINEDKDNIVIAYEIETGIKKGKNGYFFTTRSIITQNYLDLTGKPEDEQKEIIEEAEYREFYEKKSLVFPCKKADKTHIAREENVIKYAYFDLTRLGFINAPQKYCDMQKYDLNRNNQLFAIVPLVNEKGEQVEYPTFVGLENYVDHNEDLTGALHCQAGQENKVCRLIVGTPICGDAKSIVKGPSEGGRKKKTIKKNKSLTKTGKKKKTIKKTGKKKKNK